MKVLREAALGFLATRSMAGLGAFLVVVFVWASLVGLSYGASWTSRSEGIIVRAPAQVMARNLSDRNVERWSNAARWVQGVLSVEGKTMREQWNTLKSYSGLDWLTIAGVMVGLVAFVLGGVWLFLVVIPIWVERLPARLVEREFRQLYAAFRARRANERT